MTERQSVLLRRIEEAFRGVELGDGVSLHETIAIDNYEGDAQREAARALDEKHDWRKLLDTPALVEIVHVGGLSFFDAAGLRFHLPAYLSLAVLDPDRENAGEILESLMFHLTHLSDYNRARFSLLGGPERACVRDVLLFLRGEHDLEGAEIDEAIATYWSS